MKLHKGREKWFIQRFLKTKKKKNKKAETKAEDTFCSEDFCESPDFPGTSTPTTLFSRFLDKYSRSMPRNMDSCGIAYTGITETQPLRIFVATWNVGGKSPYNGLDLDDFLPADDQSDIYVLGFQEIVPLNAGNVLVVEDNEPAARWLSLINRALNGQMEPDGSSCPPAPAYLSAQSSPASYAKSPGGSLFFHKNSFKALRRSFRTVQGRRLKSCNCPSKLVKHNLKDSCLFRCPQTQSGTHDSSEDDEEPVSFAVSDADTAVSTAMSKQRFGLIACKQMVGIFVTVWARRELVQHVSHLRISCIGRGILGCLGNKGCISVSMSLYQTSFCFICSHLASGEKEGDELRRNSDVVEILKNTQFPRICRTLGRRIPEKILEHDRVIWFGDLNYRIALRYSETKTLLLQNNWNSLFEKDQLKIEREAGRVFQGWNEGKIYFAPTYKYLNNSDAYAGEHAKSEKKRRTPAWCDRILWRGDGIAQLSYIRGESKFSDHRPVIAVFVVEAEMLDSRFRRDFLSPSAKVGIEVLEPVCTYNML